MTRESCTIADQLIYEGLPKAVEAFAKGGVQPDQDGDFQDGHGLTRPNQCQL